MTNAEDAYTGALRRAKEAYTVAVVAADKRLIANLDTALTAAMNNHNVDNVLAINKAKADAQARLDADLKQTAQPATLPVDISTLIVSQHKFVYTFDSTQRILEFLPNGKIGLGAMEVEQQWRAYSDATGTHIELSGTGGSANLHRGSDGIFHGTCFFWGSNHNVSLSPAN